MLGDTGNPVMTGQCRRRHEFTVAARVNYLRQRQRRMRVVDGWASGCPRPDLANQRVRRSLYASVGDWNHFASSLGVATACALRLLLLEELPAAVSASVRQARFNMTEWST